jgi:ZIP family zinc transporter
MNLPTTLILGAIAGFTIFLGLPVARLKNPSPAWQAFLTALATGILVFLLWDILTKATEPIDSALEAARGGQSGALLLLLTLFACGLGLGLLLLVYLERLTRRRQSASAPLSPAIPVPQAAPTQLVLTIATGIGLHNFAEGLAIGQASRSGAINLAAILIIGFGLHNLTEGFGIAAPLTLGRQRPTWAFLGLAGLVGGGPTFLGTVVGYGFQSEPAFVLCLALAAGSILYVIAELLHVGRSFSRHELAVWGIFLGFLAGYFTDLLLTWGGA